MGLAIEKDHFSDDEYRKFAARLQENLLALKVLTGRPGFGNGPTTLGAELELSIVDEDGQALPVNREALLESHDPQMQLELDRFNLEYNLEPIASSGTPFRTLQAQLERAIKALNQAVAAHGGRAVPVGILPTLKANELLPSALTDMARYRALAAGLRKLRDAPFDININGPEPLRTSCNSVSLEGANTSLQIHLRVDPNEFAATFNAAQLATPIALAVSTNSPIFLGQLLWDETRIALFKQAIDSRSRGETEWRRAARVPFGYGWIRNGPLETFAEAVALFPVLIPMLSDEHPLAAIENGELPRLLELRLHQGTIWQWNRAIYDPSAGGHFRIEMRALPSGPTPVDMAASAAFMVGLVVGLRKEIDDLLPAFPFNYAEYNFYRAAERGLDAEFLWPNSEYQSPRVCEARALIEELLPVAETGLHSLEVEQSDIDDCLGLIRDRLETGMTGARWQRQVVRQLDKVYPREEALQHMLELYINQAESGQPISEWRLASPP